jgi:hypothetical protein
MGRVLALALWIVLPTSFVGASIWTYVAAQRRVVGRRVSVAAAVGTFVGLVALGLGAAHLIGVVAVAIRRTAPFLYDFRFAALLLVGVVIVFAGAVALVAAQRLARADVGARRVGLVGTSLLIASNAVLVPVQQFFGVLLLALGVTNVLALLIAPSRRT